MNHLDKKSFWSVEMSSKSTKKTIRVDTILKTSLRAILATQLVNPLTLAYGLLL